MISKINKEFLYNFISCKNGIDDFEWAYHIIELS